MYSLMFHLDKFTSICIFFLILNTLLLSNISDFYVAQEFWSNNFVLIGAYLIYYLSKKFDSLTYVNTNINQWYLVNLIWIGLVSKLTSPDPIDLPLQNFIIIYIKAQIINLLCLILGVWCIYVIFRSVYYDGILFIWTIFSDTSYKQTNVIDV